MIGGTLLRRSLSFTTSSAVYMYDFHIMKVIYSSLHGFIWNKHKDHLSVSLVAQLMERWVKSDSFFSCIFEVSFLLLLK